jgi:hypothetical protein
MFGGLGGGTWGAPGAGGSAAGAPAGAALWGAEEVGGKAVGGTAGGGTESGEEPPFTGGAADDMMAAIAGEAALGALGGDEDDDETFGGENSQQRAAAPQRAPVLAAPERYRCAAAEHGRVTCADAADSAATWNGASAVDMAAQFEQERRAHRMGIGELLTPAEHASNAPASAPAAQPKSTSTGSDLGAWLRTLGAGEFESAFREQQFETVEELVEARCAVFVRLVPLFRCLRWPGSRTPTLAGSPTRI